MKIPSFQIFTFGILAFAAMMMFGCKSWRASDEVESPLLSGAIFGSKQPVPDTESGSFTAPKPPTRAQTFARQCKDVGKKTGKFLTAFTLYTSAYLLQGWWDDLLETEDNNQEINRLWHQGYGFNNPNPQRQRDGLEPLDF